MTQEIVGKLQGERSSSDRMGEPVKDEDKRVMKDQDRTGKLVEASSHKVQEVGSLEHRDDTDKFNLAIDDASTFHVFTFFLTRCVDEQKQSRNQSTDKLTQRLNQICHIWRWAVNPCEVTLGGATREHANERAQATGPPSSPRQCCRVLHGGWYLSSPIHS